MTRVESGRAEGDRDRISLAVFLAVAFFVLGLIRLYLPLARYFDEVHYVRAARALWSGKEVLNREHPMLAKELMALSLGLFGDNTLGWRMGSLIAGSFGLFAFCRAVWHLHRSNVAVATFGVLLGTNFLLFGMARIAMLDIYMFAFVGGALAFFASGMNAAPGSCRSFAVAGLCGGLALACKWAAAPVLVCMVAAFACLRVRSPREALLGAACLVFLPLAVYLATFVPGMLVHDPLRPADLPAEHWQMFQWLRVFVAPHPLASHWWEWPLDRGTMWLYRAALDGTYRVVVLGLNPVCALASIPAILFSLWRLGRHGDWRSGGAGVLYVATLALFALSTKPVQFLYYYLLPATFATMALSDALTRLWRGGIRWPAPVLALSSALVFAWFFPALTAAPLKARSEERYYAFLPGWQPVSFNVKIDAAGKQRSMRGAWCLDHPRAPSCW
jgi:dolichyl-phosphate-mannose--protein O-mannosyl transferase